LKDNPRIIISRGGNQLDNGSRLLDDFYLPVMVVTHWQHGFILLEMIWLSGYTPTCIEYCCMTTVRILPQ